MKRLEIPLTQYDEMTMYQKCLTNGIYSTASKSSRSKITTYHVGRLVICFTGTFYLGHASDQQYSCLKIFN